MAKMRITVVGTDRSPAEKIVSNALSPGSDEQPVPLEHWARHWRYQGKTFRVDGADYLSAE